MQALDAELARRAGEAGRLRFEMGRGLDLLEQSGGHHALGFSSIEAYALERCERSASWTQKARGLARRLEALPVLVNALISGSLNWSMASVLATVASPDDAEFWLAEASRRTVREMKALVLEKQGVPDGGDDGAALEAEAELRTLTLTVPREDAWCFEQAKLLGRHLGERTNADFVLGLVAESTSTLCSELPSNAIELADDVAMSPQRAWELELARMRAEAEARCESHFLGTSLSSIKAKRRLVKRLGQLRFLADAVDRGELGYEAARLVAEVATGATVEAWVTRASERTLRHLREEIDSAELLARWSGSTAVLPPSDAEVRRVEDLERAVVTGQMSAPPALPPTAGAPSATVTLHLRVSADTARDFRHWEAIYLRHRGSALRDTTFLRFACELFLDTWLPRGSDVEYAHIYERDRHRCQSPCCGRRDVTPHHLRFRSRGGDDSDENLTSLCTWCHLEGIHRGQISAVVPAGRLVSWVRARGRRGCVGVRCRSGPAGRPGFAG